MSTSGTPSQSHNNGRSLLNNGQSTPLKRKESSDSFALSLQEAMNASTSHNAVVGDYYSESQSLPRRGQGQGQGRGRGRGSATRGRGHPSQPQTQSRTHSPSVSVSRKSKPKRAVGANDPELPVPRKKPILVPSREASPVRIPGDVLALQKDAHGDELVMLYVGKQWDFMAFPGLFEFEFEDETKGDDPFVQLNLETNSGSVRTMNTRWIRQSNESRQALLLASGESERERQESPRPVGDGKGKGNFIPPLSLSFSSSSTRLWKGKPLGMDATPGKCFEEYWLPGGDRDHEDDGKDESNILPTLDISSDSDSEDSDSSVDSVSQRPTKALTTSAVTPAVTSSLASTATGARKEWPEGDLTYYCHQCRRPTTRVYMKCKNEGTKCKIKYCIRCVTQRYPQVEFNTSRTDFTCLRCQGICNCDLCCKKRGDTYLPTKFLFENLDAPSQENTPLKHVNLSEREARVLPVLSAKGKEKEKFVPPSSASARLGKAASARGVGSFKGGDHKQKVEEKDGLNIIDVSSDSDNDSDDAGSDSRPTKTSTTALTSTLPTSHSKPKLTSLPKLSKPTLGTPSTASTQRAKLPIPKTNKPTQRPVAAGSQSTSTNPTQHSLASFSPPSSLASLLPKASSASAHGSGKGSSRFTGSSSTNAAGPSTLKHSTQIGSPAPRLGRNLKEVVQGGSSSGLEGHASASSSRVPSAMGPGPAGPQPSQGSTATESQPTPAHSVLLRKWDEKGAESLTIGEMRELVEALRIKSTEGVVNGLNGTHTTEEDQRQDLESRHQEQHRSQPDDGNDDGKEKKRKRATSGVEKVRSVHTTEEGPLVGPQDLDSLRKDHHRDDEDDDGKKKKRKRASGVENVGSVHTTEEGPLVGPQDLDSLRKDHHRDDEDDDSKKKKRKRVSGVEKVRSVVHTAEEVQPTGRQNPHLDDENDDGKKKRKRKPNWPTGNKSYQCHHCRSRTDMLHMHCSNSCVLKFCVRCITNSYKETTFNHEKKDWVCVRCQGICTCSKCRNRVTKKKGKARGSASDDDDVPRVIKRPRLSLPANLESESEESEQEESEEAESEEDMYVAPRPSMAKPKEKNKTGRTTTQRRGWPEGDVTYHCHQCRSSMKKVFMQCKNGCGLRYCIRCITQRYPNIGFDASRDDFECFRCEGVCNCTSCCRKRGDTYFPTKALFDDSSQKNTTPKRTSLALRPAKPLPSSKRTFVGDVQDDWELGNDSMLESTEMDVGSSRPAKGKTPSRSYKQADPHCHQCRSRRPVYMKCKNEDTGCTSKYCVRCVKQRYPDVEFDASREDFSCFRCEETCNCNLCCRKRGDEYFTTKALLEDLDVRSQRDTAETPQSSLGPCRVIDTSLLPSTASPSSE